LIRVQDEGASLASWQTVQTANLTAAALSDLALPFDAADVFDPDELLDFTDLPAMCNFLS
jgi:hypothetical protein